MSVERDMADSVERSAIDCACDVRREVLRLRMHARSDDASPRMLAWLSGELVELQALLAGVIEGVERRTSQRLERP